MYVCLYPHHFLVCVCVRACICVCERVRILRARGYIHIVFFFVCFCYAKGSFFLYIYFRMRLSFLFFSVFCGHVPNSTSDRERMNSFFSFPPSKILLLRALLNDCGFGCMSDHGRNIATPELGVRIICLSVDMYVTACLCVCVCGRL